MSEYDDIFAAAEKKPEEISVQPFDKEEWIQQKKAEREAAYLMIDQTAELLPFDGERIKTYLDLQSRFPRYSVGNVLLLSAQRPEATRIADYKTWKDSGAYIQKGETGIIILEPGNEYTRGDGSVGVSYNAKRVFDISQTSAKEAPQPEVHRDGRLLLKTLIYNAPCEIRLADDRDFSEGMAAVYDPQDRIIYVERGHDAKELFQDIAQELAHAHMDTAVEKGSYNRAEHAFPAFCVSYMICRRNGIDVSDFRFEPPESFKALDSKGVRAELGKMRDVANSISADMDRMTEKQKDAKARDDAR